MKHIMELIGKTRVVVDEGRVVEVGRPSIQWCPLFSKVRGIESITPDEAQSDMEFRMEELGMFTSHRSFESDIFVGFGASETMMSGLERGYIDAAVTTCDGAGTVITANPELVQGIGAQMSGLVQTEPIRETIEAIEALDGVVLDKNTGAIDQVRGFELAAAHGFSRIAVTVVDPQTATGLRERAGEMDATVIIIGVHLTGISKTDAEALIKQADIITACASAHIRRLVKPLLQVGVAIPLFALTQTGKELLIERAKDVQPPLLMNTQALPCLPSQKQPRPLE